MDFHESFVDEFVAARDLGFPFDSDVRLRFISERQFVSNQQKVRSFLCREPSVADLLSGFEIGSVYFNDVAFPLSFSAFGPDNENRSPSILYEGICPASFSSSLIPSDRMFFARKFDVDSISERLSYEPGCLSAASFVDMDFDGFKSWCRDFMCKEIRLSIYQDKELHAGAVFSPASDYHAERRLYLSLMESASSSGITISSDGGSEMNPFVQRPPHLFDVVTDGAHDFLHYYSSFDGVHRLCPFTASDPSHVFRCSSPVFESRFSFKMKLRAGSLSSPIDSEVCLDKHVSDAVER